MTTILIPTDAEGWLIVPVSQWLPIPGWEDRYQVSDHGQVRSARRRGTTGKTLKPWQDGRGYLQVSLSRPGLLHTRKVHQLVLEAFVGARPREQEGRHLNGDPTDNRAVNLAWGTRSEQRQDDVRNGVNPHSRKTHCPRDHPYDEENTRFETRGSRRYRRCRACERERTWRRRHG